MYCSDLSVLSVRQWEVNPGTLFFERTSKIVVGQRAYLQSLFAHPALANSGSFLPPPCTRTQFRNSQWPRQAVRINSPTSIWTRLPERKSGLSVPPACASPSVLILHSKSELKKRQKQRALEEKKKEKAAAAPSKPKPEKTASAEEEESQLTPNVRPIDPPMDLHSLATDHASRCSNISKSGPAKSRSYGRARHPTPTRTSSRSLPI